jgi:hypothetical protein
MGENQKTVDVLYIIIELGTVKRGCVSNCILENIKLK